MAADPVSAVEDELDLTDVKDANADASPHA